MIKRHGFSVNTIDPKFDGTIESLQSYIAEVCSVVRDKDPKSHVRLWDRLMKESYGDKPSSVFKFIPCIITNEQAIGAETNQLFGFWDDLDDYNTSARELLNWGWTWEQILPTVDFTHYRAWKGMAMYKVYQQLRTHSIPAWISHSQRYTESEHGYWYPDEYKERMLEDGVTDDEDIDEEWHSIVTGATPVWLFNYMANRLGIPRREIYALGSDMLQKRVFSGGGYINNPNDLPHLLQQRAIDPHTQLETRQWTQMLSEELDINLEEL